MCSGDTYSTKQDYGYDVQSQLTSAVGETVYKPYGSTPEYTAKYNQTFDFDSIGNMTNKKSSSNVTPKKTIGAELNYNLDYGYYSGSAHKVEHAGSRFYRYDGNGNLIAEREGGHAPVNETNANVYNDGSLYYTDYGFGITQTVEPTSGAQSVYQRTYEWNERNLLRTSSDNNISVNYRYGADGQRAVKFSAKSETLYFNTMWMMRTDPLNTLRQSKNIYVGQSRIATKSNFQGDNNLGYEVNNTYWYHSDHLGSAQLVTNVEGKEHERIEYTPYGELWVEKTANGVDKLPFRFTGKEFDDETGLYYYGARYLDPKTSRWLSTDPALGEYMPDASVSEEARKQNGNLPGMGGIFNIVNMQLYHYAGNNPVKYTDPDGRIVNLVTGAVAAAIGAGIGAGIAMASGASGNEIAAAAVGGAVYGGMAGLSMGVSIGVQIGGATLAGTAGYMASNIVKGEGNTVVGTISSGLNGASGSMFGQSIGKVGELLKVAVNSPYISYMQNTDTSKVTPLLVTFKDTTSKMNTNNRHIDTATEASKQVVDAIKDVYLNGPSTTSPPPRGAGDNPVIKYDGQGSVSGL